MQYMWENIPGTTRRKRLTKKPYVLSNHHSGLTPLLPHNVQFSISHFRFSIFDCGCVMPLFSKKPNSSYLFPRAVFRELIVIASS